MTTKLILTPIVILLNLNCGAGASSTGDIFSGGFEFYGSCLVSDAGYCKERAAKNVQHVELKQRFLSECSDFGSYSENACAIPAAYLGACHVETEQIREAYYLMETQSVQTPTDAESYCKVISRIGVFVQKD